MKLFGFFFFSQAHSGQPMAGLGKVGGVLSWCGHGEPQSCLARPLPCQT